MDDEPDFDFMDPQVVGARDNVARAIAAYLNVIRPDENPYVVAWCVGAEWTNAELEQTARAGRDIIMPTEQSLSASAGLGVYLTNRFA